MIQLLNKSSVARAVNETWDGVGVGDLFSAVSNILALFRILLSLVMRANGKCNNSYAPSTS